MILHFPDENELAIDMDDENDNDYSELNKKAVLSKLEEITKQAALEGEIPSKLLGLTHSIYGSAKVNWRNMLKQFLTGKGRMQSHKTIKRISKQFADMPVTKDKKV